VRIDALSVHLATQPEAVRAATDADLEQLAIRVRPNAERRTIPNRRITVHPFTQVQLARARRRDLDRSLDARIPPTGIAETPHTLEPVTPDPFIDDLNTPTAADSARLDLLSAAPQTLNGRASRERQRSRVLASLLARPERATDTPL